MTCEDCLYKGFCENQYGDTDYFDDVEEFCGTFKDKNKIIELPCELGGEVYVISPARHILTRKFAGIHISTVKSRVGKRIDYIIVTNEIGTERYDMRKIGKIIFFDKTEAENKLKGGKI